MIDGHVCGFLHTFPLQLHAQIFLSFADIPFHREAFRNIIYQIVQVPAVIFHEKQNPSLRFPENCIETTVESRSQTSALVL